MIKWNELKIGSAYIASWIIFCPYIQTENVAIMLCNYNSSPNIDHEDKWEIDIYYSHEWTDLKQSREGREKGSIEEYFDSEDLNKNRIYRLTIKKIFNEEKKFLI